MKLGEFEKWVQRAIDGDLDEGEWRALEEALLESAEFRRIFRHSFRTHDLIRLHAEASVSAYSVGRSRLPGAEMLARQRRKAVKAAFISAAAILLLSAVLLRHVLTTAPENRIAVSPGTIYHLARTHAVSPNQSESLQPRDRIVIDAGAMRLDLKNGVMVLLKGPAEAEFVDAGCLSLEKGSVFCQVPAAARGFTIESKRIRLVDLGTEFGMEVQDGMSPEVHVFRGKVQVRALEGRRDGMVLEKGQSATLSTVGSWTLGEADDGRFFQSLPTELPHFRLSFDRIEGERLEVEGCLPESESLEARWPSMGAELDRGKIGTAVHFDGEGEAITSNWRGISGDLPRTLCAWIRLDEAPEFRRFQPIVGWGRFRGGEDADVGVGKCELLVFRKTPEEAPQLRLSFDGLLLTGSLPLTEGQWHHVAAVYHGGRISEDHPPVELYVDGQLDPIDPERSLYRLGLFDTPMTSSDGLPLLIGSSPSPEPDRGFRGSIDELFVFGSALTQAQVMNLMANGELED
ncbi:hypothetical protein HNR46_000930 [Haloferula luteola]|uniref:FecR protein n=1 Tax=Haloferula luteola TaxID=595692 RepID=A0A840UY45_9BACT|nr:LamG-like jellyroll fold domain-containing protein [Haloferula luteola]MBB5350702.1 hypothetical protein [Haloferula luteola]